ncbi:hypothetical protein L3Q82_006228 [Scortum barcoo]|uniref:Uncharacterized protein n=1 Tax=Scortum barcoo TaxID=214431 RepID=A0ACB8X2Z4_9TELE|nr:hypothetical protein L3Q82_006228 [Scortum barcoo]
MCARYLGFVLVVWFPGVLQDVVACFPPDIPNAEDTANVDGWYRNGSRISIKCKDGYEPKGQNVTATCINGEWSTLPVCDKSNNACGEPPETPHAVIVQEYRKVFPENSQVHYECEDGYAVGQGSTKSITCRAGEWTEGPTCNERACLPPTIPNGKYNESSNGWYEDGFIISIKCEPGYEPKGWDVTCKNGIWSPLVACERSNNACGEPPKISHAVIVHQGYREVFPENSQVHYECRDGYTVDGQDSTKSITCRAGEWTEGPTCSRDTTEDTDTEPYSEDNVTFTDMPTFTFTLIHDLKTPGCHHLTSVTS